MQDAGWNLIALRGTEEFAKHGPSRSSGERFIQLEPIGGELGADVPRLVSHAHVHEVIRDAALSAEMALRVLARDAALVLNAPFSAATETAARVAVEFVAQLFATLIDQGGIPVDFQEMVTPHWLKPAGAPKPSTQTNG